MHTPSGSHRTRALLAGILVVSVTATVAIHAKTRPESDEVEVPAAPPAALPNRVELFSPEQPDSAGVLRTCADRVYADAPSHLAVFKDGVCIFDRGLRRVSAQTTHERTGVITETGLVDTAWVAPDGRGALVGMLQFTDSLKLGANEDSDDHSALRPNTKLTWIDPSSPEGSFEVALEPGRLVKDAEALPLGFGAAVMTQMHDAIDADFRIYNLSGKLLFQVPEREASTTSIAASNVGGFVMVDLALVATPGGPDRALRVYDLLQGKSWQYTWAYGGDDEPLSWEFADSGELEVHLPDRTLHLDRTGKIHGEAKSGKSGRHSGGVFNRMRN